MFNDFFKYNFFGSHEVTLKGHFVAFGTVAEICFGDIMPDWAEVLRNLITTFSAKLSHSFVQNS